MAALPGDIQFSRITGTIGVLVTDTASDLDSVPDYLGLNGTVSFRPASTVFVNDATNTVLLSQSGLEYPIRNGILTDVDNHPWIDLVASNSTGLAIDQPFTWTASFALTGATFGPITFLANAGDSQDISELVSISPAVGNVTQRGPAGDSAYEIAVQNGFVGTEQEWLASLHGSGGGGGGAGTVTSVNGKLPNAGGAVTLAIADIPSLQAALDSKAPAAGIVKSVNTKTPNVSGAVTVDIADVPNLSTNLAGKAPLGATGTAYTAPVAGQVGYWQHLLLQFAALAGGTDPEPLMVEALRNGTYRRAFWLNENGSPRGASVNDEPALKLFGPDANHSYVGMLMQIFNNYGQQTHRWSMHSDGNARVGTGATAAAFCVVVAKGATAPTGLPDGTLIFELPT